MEKILLVIALVLIMPMVWALPVMLLWNALLPDLFGFQVINFWQALGLAILCSILFKSSNTSGSDK